MALAFHRCHSCSRDAGDQAQMNVISDDEQDWPRHYCGDDRSYVRAQKGKNAKAHEQIPSGVHTEHHQLALREVNNAHDAKDHSEASTHEAVQATNHQAGRKSLKKILEQNKAGSHNQSYLTGQDTR